MTTTPPRGSLLQLGWSLLTALSLLALLTWVLFLPARVRARTTRPPLPTPVTLDTLVEPRPLASSAPSLPNAKSDAASPSEVGRDGLKGW